MLTTNIMIMQVVLILMAVLLSGTIVSYILPKILLVSLRKRLVDPIDPRKVHKSTAIRLGGVSFFPAIFISLSICIILVDMSYDVGFDVQSAIFVEAAALLILYSVGLYDDIIGVKYRSKFVMQIVTAVMLTASGTYLKSIYFFDGVITMPVWFSVPFTILLIVFVTNAINLIDGINGLASMLSIIALIVYGVVFFLVDNSLYAAICFISAGAIAPFWYHNVFGIRKRNTTRIFMGDCGALVVGFLLSIMAIRVWNIPSGSSEYISSNVCHILAYTVLFVPCLDVVRVVLHRKRKKKPLFLPDNSHIHHKFMALGCTPQQALGRIVGIQVGFLLLNLLLCNVVNIINILIIDLIVWTIMHILLTKRIKDKNVNK